MRLSRAIPIFACVLTCGVLGYGQNVKPGLYENTSTVTWQQSPLPPGMQMPAGSQSPFPGGPQTHTYQVCVTQEQIDRMGPVIPEQWGQNCRLTNIAKSAVGMRADVICSGEVQGQGTFEALFAPEGGGSGKLHFVGQMVTPQFSAPVEFTSQMTSVYKGGNCGGVKPEPLPSDESQ